MSVSFKEKQAGRKLSPVDLMKNTTRRLRPVPRAPFCCSTYVSIQATCPDSCPFKRLHNEPRGCYVDSGFTRMLSQQLDEAAAHLDGISVMCDELEAIDAAFKGGRIPQDGARGGRDLRLHVGGDISGPGGAVLLSGAARRWRARGGGQVWTYTHRWAEVPRQVWGESISPLASVESPSQLLEACDQGYAPAIVVEEFPSGKLPFDVHGVRFIPCPAETLGKTCVECRLCFDDVGLRARNQGIAFRAHGGHGDRELALVAIGARRSA